MLVNTRLQNGESHESVSFEEAILSPMSAHGGLWAPAHFAKLDFGSLSKDYKELSLQIIRAFGINESLVKSALARYDSFDNGEAVELLLNISEN